MKKFIILSLVLLPSFVSAATLSVSSSSYSVNVGDTFTANIILNTGGSSSYGVDINRLNFTPGSLQVVDADTTKAGVQITPGTLMSNTVINSVDNVGGTIQFSQLTAPPSTYSGSGTLATITFRAVTAGTSNVTFDFVLGRGNDSNVAGFVAGLAGDLLSSVSNGSYTVASSSDTPPTILNINIPSASITSSSVQVKWDTNEPTISSVQYGRAIPSYGSVTAPSSLTISPSFTLSNLLPNALYHYRAISTDATGNTTTSGDGTFSTLGTPPSNDADNDGILNTNDKCPNTPFGVTPNTFGCPLPKFTRFTVKPTTNRDLNQVSFDLGTSYGKVSFINAPLVKANGDSLDIDSYLTIAKASVILNSTLLPELNRPATITLYNLSFTTVKILRDGILCTTCGTPTYSNGTLIFTVPSFSTYSVIEGTDPSPATHTVTVSKQGSGSGTVTSSGGSINCGSVCSMSVNANQSITLSSSSSTFTGWSGGYCSGTGSCTFTPTQDSTVIATFTAPILGGGGGGGKTAAPINIPPPNVITSLTAVPGCGNRTTGFSTVTGQSCVGNKVTGSTGSGPSAYNFGTVTLRNGSKGEAVKELQRFLNRFLNLGLVVDGKLGPKTIAVIKKWQKDNGLVVDGLIGAKTKAKMNAMAR